MAILPRLIRLSGEASKPIVSIRLFAASIAAFGVERP
jgi:hypothetical protein